MGTADSILIPNEIRRMSGESISRPAIAATISNVLFSKDWREEIDRRTIRRSGRYLLVCNITQPLCDELIDLDDSKSQPLATCHIPTPKTYVTYFAHHESYLPSFTGSQHPGTPLDLKRANATVRCRCMPPRPSGLHRISWRAGLQGRAE